MPLAPCQGADRERPVTSASTSLCADLGAQGTQPLTVITRPDDDAKRGTDARPKQNTEDEFDSTRRDDGREQDQRTRSQSSRRRQQLMSMDASPCLGTALKPERFVTPGHPSTEQSNPWRGNSTQESERMDEPRPP